MDAIDTTHLFQGSFDRSARDKTVEILDQLKAAIDAAETAIDALEAGTTLPDHAANHQDGGEDEIATETAAAGAIPKAGETGVLGEDWIPDLSEVYAPLTEGAIAAEVIPDLSATYQPTGTYPVLVAAPAAANSTGVAGQIAYDAGFLYVCVDTDTWLQVAIATWGE